LAYSVNFTVTNRWHRDDLEYLKRHLTPTKDFLFKTIQFISPWIKPHMKEDGSLVHHTSFSDYEVWIFNVLELFDQLETIIIDVPIRWAAESRREIFVDILGSSMRLAIEGSPNTYIEGLEWQNWRFCMERDYGFMLYGRNKQSGRAVQVICQSAYS